ncbi:uncharacterized protein LOC105637951 [Jatropha curcas]|uniref:uncharacterized protein LOC105637951 n=1 Tax=Jatropha curcas TaxID=180498 RepID=UPI0018955557|nr:uncharacterized protein LOC105637951 [Jatropha curcas]
MAKNEDTGSPGWKASLFLQTTEDVARAVAAAAAAATAPRSPRPSVVFSSKDDSGDSHLQKLQRQVARMIKGFSSPPPEVKGVTYNPEVLTSQKRQWANFQLQYLDHRSLKEPLRLFESMVVVGLHPNCDLQTLHRQYVARKSEVSGRLQSSLGSQNQSRVEPILEPQVLFVYPPDKQLPLKYKDLLSFCFPGGLEVHAVERTPSMSELNEILLGQEHLKKSDLSFVFRLQVADDSTLYGCCVLVDEIVQKPSGLLSMISDKRSSCSSLSRHVLTTRRCYCILSRLPFFELHFGVLNSIFTEERLERLTKDIGVLNLQSLEDYSEKEGFGNNLDGILPSHGAAEEKMDGKSENFQSSLTDSTFGGVADDRSHLEHQIPEGQIHLSKKDVDDNIVPDDSETEIVFNKGESGGGNLEDCDTDVDDLSNKQAEEKRLPNAVLPLLRYYQYESSDSSSRYAFLFFDVYYMPMCERVERALSEYDDSTYSALLRQRTDRATAVIPTMAGVALQLCGSLASRELSLVPWISQALILQCLLTVSGAIGYYRRYAWQFFGRNCTPFPYISEYGFPGCHKFLDLLGLTKSPTVPQLPKHKELFSSLSPYHAKLVGESYLARKRPVYECTDVQVEAAKDFLAVLRSYLDSLCSNLRSHTITNVQSNNDKVSLLLKESFIDSFPNRDRPFMKLFVDTQLFSVHTDLVLSFFQKE